VLKHSLGNIELNLKSQNFRTLDFVIYRFFRLLLLPTGRRFSAKLAAHLHWIFRHLAIATSSNYFGVDFLNTRSAIVKGSFVQKYTKASDYVVDVACGTARYLPLLQSVGVSKFLGIDNSDFHIRNNKESYPTFEFIKANALGNESIPVCDILIASHFLEHLDSPDSFLRSISDKCRLIFIEVPDFYSDPINTTSFQIGAPWWTDRDHRREYSEDSLDKLLFECNYRVLDKCFSGGTIGVVASPLS
jgi:SAM-dependent methyltransferase